MILQPMPGMLAACDCPTCPERGFIVEVPNERERRCHVCGWLMRLFTEDDKGELKEAG